MPDGWCFIFGLGKIPHHKIGQPELTKLIHDLFSNRCVIAVSKRWARRWGRRSKLVAQ